MKKIICLVLSALMLFTLCACNNTSQKRENNSSQSTPTRAPKEESTNTSVEEIYNDFLAGKITVKHGSEYVTINEFTNNSSGTPQYALFDRNGDKVPELCIDNGYFITTFWVSDSKLAVWREESYKMQILSNGNALQQGNGGVPNHFNYNYITYSYTGDIVCEVYLSHYPKNDIEVLKDEYYMNVYVNDGVPSEAIDGIEISKEQYEKRTQEILSISKADIDWKTIE